MWGEWVGNEAYAYYADCLSALRERLYSLYLSMYIVYAMVYAMWEHVCVPSGCLSSAIYFYLIFFLPFWTFINTRLWCRLRCAVARGSARCLIIINWVIVSKLTVGNINVIESITNKHKMVERHKASNNVNSRNIKQVVYFSSK